MCIELSQTPTGEWIHHVVWETEGNIMNKLFHLIDSFGVHLSNVVTTSTGDRIHHLDQKEGIYTNKRSTLELIYLNVITAPSGELIHHLDREKEGI